MPVDDGSPCRTRRFAEFEKLCLGPAMGLDLRFVLGYEDGQHLDARCRIDWALYHSAAALVSIGPTPLAADGKGALKAKDDVAGARNDYRCRRGGGYQRVHGCRDEDEWSSKDASHNSHRKDWHGAVEEFVHALPDDFSHHLFQIGRVYLGKVKGA